MREKKGEEIRDREGEIQRKLKEEERRRRKKRGKERHKKLPCELQPKLHCISMSRKERRKNRERMTWVVTTLFTALFHTDKLLFLPSSHR